MEIDSYKSYLKAYSKTTRIAGNITKVVDLKEFCPTGSWILGTENIVQIAIKYIGNGF